ncbi:MAG: HAMP domain-containing sensor histidine kinase, partial [Pseudomonadota bacterium]
DPNIVVTVFGLGLLTCCYLGVRWLFNPIHGIQRGMRRIGRGDLDYRFHPTRSDEFGELTRDIDRLTERVQDMLDSKRELLLAISHEMRSPLTRMKLALEFDNDDAREALADDVAELETIIRELLEAERLNEAHVALAVSAVTPLELVHEVLAENFPGERVEMQQRGAARAASWDVTRIKLLLKNLIHNALKHGRGEGPVQVGVDTTSAEHVEIAVSDDGPGMPDEALARATEPFYRADPSRSRKSGGLGLGLYLASRVAEAHGGSLILARNGARGLKATAVLPNEPPSDDDSAG